MNIQVKPGATSPHVKTQSLICGTLVTTDLKRARRMYEERARHGMRRAGKGP